MNKLIYTLFLTGSFLASQAQEIRWNTPGAGNPFIPGYFADPTVKKFGDTYYIYATTDGSGAGFGPSQLWCSKDFENWTLMPMNWPDSHWIWAPDVMQHTDGTYRLFYCQPCNRNVPPVLLPAVQPLRRGGRNAARPVEKHFGRKRGSTGSRPFREECHHAGRADVRRRRWVGVSLLGYVGHLQGIRLRSRKDDS